MNAVEIEEAVSDLAAQPFDRAEFPYAFLTAFGNKDTTIKRLRAGNTNASDIPGGVLQRNHIHMSVCDDGQVSRTLVALRESPKTKAAKARFVLATDGVSLEAEDTQSGETIACAYPDFAERFGFFLPLAGISTIKEIKNNPIDVRATGRLNKLYVELLKDNPDWAAADRRHDMNHFMARLIFCFFAEDTDIFHGEGLFTATVAQMTEKDSSNTHDVISAIFRAMNTKVADRASSNLPRWANGFPYVNGGLFSGSTDVPRFSKIARSFLLHVGDLKWREINPDIFGSMIQAVADDEERGALGMHYTSVPNILKVLNPLFLDDLREQLEAAGTNARMLLNLRKRMSRIRVFDPACGSGNFLVIAYKEMRKIEAEINRRRSESDLRTEVPLTNFRGIELRDFPAEIARLALIIAEFQCDVLYRGQKEALAEFLPLDTQNWITCGNALRLDWLSICPPTGTGVKLHGDDLFNSPLDQAQIDFENEGGETYICGNPPYLGKGKKEDAHQEDMDRIFQARMKQWGYIDYVGCWLLLAADYCRAIPSSSSALVATNSICQGRQLPQLWPAILVDGIEISFAHLSFKWSNSATRNAGVMCVVIGFSHSLRLKQKIIYSGETARVVRNINAYLIEGDNIFVQSSPLPLSPELPKLVTGSVPNDGGHLILSEDEKKELLYKFPQARKFVRRFLGSQDFLQGDERSCLFILDQDLQEAIAISEISARLQEVSRLRLKSPKKETRQNLSQVPHRFQHVAGHPKRSAIIVPSVSSESREWFPVGLLDKGNIVSNLAFIMIDVPTLCISVASSRLHLAWLATVCGKLKNDYRYSNTLGWHTFPIPKLTTQNKADLERCAENILLAREAHFPATIADLYDPETMPDDLRRAHDQNDEVLERIYIGRRFRNDTERLEKLFELYTKMTAGGQQPARKAKRMA
jgi:hypothetical protein